MLLASEEIAKKYSHAKPVVLNHLDEHAREKFVHQEIMFTRNIGLAKPPSRTCFDRQLCTNDLAPLTARAHNPLVPSDL